METKICKTCNIEKELSSFYTIFDKRRNHDYSFSSCRSCIRSKTYKWRKENPEKEKEIQKRNSIKNGKKYKHNFYQNNIQKNWIKYSQRRKELDLKKKYPKQALCQKLLEIQDNACAICKGSFVVVGRYDVDHSHKTGLIRGLLCRKCNSGLHYFEDKEFIIKAEKYIEEHPALKFPSVKY